jgi:hypothetical protein
MRDKSNLLVSANWQRTCALKRCYYSLDVPADNQTQLNWFFNRFNESEQAVPGFNVRYILVFI